MLHTALIIQLLAASALADEIHIFKHPAMGTEFEIRVAAPYEFAEPAAAETFALIDAIEEEISSWRETSYTTYVNKHAAENPVRVSPNVLNLFIESQRISSETFGAFDPTIGPLLDAWKIRSGGEAASDDALANARPIVGMHHVRIDESESTIAYDRPGVWVDWGAIGKGYALDLATKLLRERNFNSALLSAGTSTIVAIGAPPGESGWSVDIPNASITLRDTALSSSVCFENDSNPCDILDPRSGRPVSIASSATVITATGTEADALSTALLVMSRDEAERYFAENKQHRAIRFNAEGATEKYNWID